VTRKLAGDTSRTVALLVQVVDRADVVETTASNKVATRGIGAGHDPRGSQGNGVHLVGGIGIPDNEFTILRGRDEVPPIG